MYTLITLILLVIIGGLLVRNHRVKRARAEIEHEFADTSGILDSLNDGLIECDASMVPIRINRAAENLLGIDASMVVNRAIDKNNLKSDLERLLARILFVPESAIRSGGGSYNHDLLLPAVPADKEERKLRIFTFPKTSDKGGALIGYIKIVRDVSIELAIVNHKNDVVYIVSHQLLTPLTGVKWILKSILDGDGGIVSIKQGEMLRKGVIASEQMVDLVTDILDVAKVEQASFSYKKLPHDIVTFTQTAVTGRAEKAKLRSITIKSESNLQNKIVIFDQERLGLALGNIIDNALDYSPVGTTVMVRLEGNANVTNIIVTDHGIGIPQSDRGKIFAKFYRAENAKHVRTGGTGLGLYLAKNIIEAHGGTIAYSSKENEGSTFTISLPDALTNKPDAPTEGVKTQAAFV